jgi:hypothetical protein
MHSDRDLWLWAGGALTAVGLTLVAVAGGLLAARDQYDFWRSPPMLAAYVCGALALVCFAAAVREMPFPFGQRELPSQPPQLVQHNSSTQLDKPGERIFADITPRYLVGLFKGHTDLQAKPLTKPFLGKWMRVSGVLGNVLSNRANISQVTFQSKSPFAADYEAFTVFMYFDRKQWGRSPSGSTAWESHHGCRPNPRVRSHDGSSRKLRAGGLSCCQAGQWNGSRTAERLPQLQAERTRSKMATRVYFIGTHDDPILLKDEFDRVNSQLTTSDKGQFSRVVPHQAMGSSSTARVTVYRSAVAYIEEAGEAS